jgi:hypothetical protein
MLVIVALQATPGTAAQAGDIEDMRAGAIHWQSAQTSITRNTQRN